MAQSFSQECRIRRRPSKRDVKSLGVMPDVRNQNGTTAGREVAMDSFNEFPSDAPASGRQADDQFAHVSSETQIVCTDKAENLSGVLPDKCKAIGCGQSTFNDILTPVVLPEARLRLHERLDRRDVAVCRLSYHFSANVADHSSAGSNERAPRTDCSRGLAGTSSTLPRGGSDAECGRRGVWRANRVCILRFYLLRCGKETVCEAASGRCVGGGENFFHKIRFYLGERSDCSIHFIKRKEHCVCLCPYRASKDRDCGWQILIRQGLPAAGMLR